MKSATVHQLNGNPGRRPLRELGAFNPEAAELEAPDHLTDAARAEWERIVPLLFKYGMVTDVDTAALALYCQAYGTWVHAAGEVQKLQSEGKGLVVLSPNGYPQQHAWVSIANNAMEKVHTYLQSFGLSPASRAKVTPTTQRGLFDDGDGESRASEAKDSAAAGTERFFR